MKYLILLLFFFIIIPNADARDKYAVSTCNTLAKKLANNPNLTKKEKKLYDSLIFEMCLKFVMEDIK